ncbi:hypothetical protein E3J79_03110 [Candidatus Dependentiae bacterium]|nr:MAG: hypothetical protein E3J79_03110 [Candidatus Dependentiae bacterium]
MVYGKLWIFLLFFHVSIQKAYLKSITVWQKDNSLIFGCADVHDYNETEVNKEHRQKIRDILVECRHHNPLVLVEDFKDYSGNDSEIIEFLSPLKAITPLDGLGIYCKQQQLDTVNLEYRFARRVALTPIDDLERELAQTQGTSYEKDIRRYLSYDSLVKSARTSCKKFVQEFDTTVETISAFNDGSKVNAHYSEHIDAVCGPSSETLFKLRLSDQSMAAYVYDAIPFQKRLAFVTLLTCWDARLLDLKAIHEIATHHNQDRIFYLFMGALHMARVGHTLEQLLEYKKKMVIGHESPVKYFPLLFSTDEMPDRDKFFNNKSKSTSDIDRKPIPAQQLAVLLKKNFD